MEQYMNAQQPHGLRLWQTKSAFYPAHVAAASARREQVLSIEQLEKEGGVEQLTSQLITARTVHDIFPYMLPKEFDQVMVDLGPQAWREAIDKLPPNTAKALILMIVGRKTLRMYFYPVLAEYASEEVEVAYRLYEVGLGRCVRQMMLKDSAELQYYHMMNPLFGGKCLFVLPELRFANVDLPKFTNNKMLSDVTKLEKGLAYDLNGKTLEEEFVIRMVCVSATCKNNQWTECWAHSLSALDHVPPNEEIRKKYVHDLFCFLGHAAGRCFIRSVAVFKALDYAVKYSCNLEHPWKRLLVFQDLTIQWGFFHLENEVFEKGLAVIPGRTDYFSQLVELHLKALMHKVENILLYQWTRQKFHVKCNARTCKKPMNVEYSFLKVEELIHDIEFWSRVFDEPGVCEYYSGMVHLYTACRIDGKQSSEHFTQAIFYFNRCLVSMRQIYQRHTDATCLVTMLTKKKIEWQSVMDKFSPATHLMYSAGASETYVRLLLLTIYFPEEYFYVPECGRGKTMDYYYRATNARGYRVDLLRVSDTVDMKYHVDEDAPEDHPLLSTCLEKELLDDVAATRYWKRELARVVPYSDNDPERPLAVTSFSPASPPSTPKRVYSKDAGPSSKRACQELKHLEGKKKTRRRLAWDIDTVPEDKSEDEGIGECDESTEGATNFFLPTSKVFLRAGNQLSQETYLYGNCIAKMRIRNNH